MKNAIFMIIWSTGWCSARCCTLVVVHLSVCPVWWEPGCCLWLALYAPCVLSSIFTGPDNQMQDETLPSHSKAELETLHFLEDPRKDLSSLDSYPLIKRLFVRFNTTLPSSAPVERLFSFAGLVNRPHRRSLTPEMLEKLVFLKNNWTLTALTGLWFLFCSLIFFNLWISI